MIVRRVVVIYKERRPMSEKKDVLQEAIDSVNEYGSITEAAKTLGIARQTLSTRYNKAIDKGYDSNSSPELGVEYKLRKINKEKRKALQKNEELYKILEEKQIELDALLGFKDKLYDIKSDPIEIKEDKTKSKSVAVVLCSDFHGEETVDPSTVDNLNEYNRSIAERRLENFFKNTLKLVDMSRNKSDIDTLVLWLGGDFINGYIHEELMEMNSLSPVDACLWIYKLLISGIDLLLENGNFKRIIVPTNVGNHGRTTLKRRVSTSVQNSFEWMLYNFLSLKYSGDKRIDFKLTKGYFNFLKIYGYVLRFHHGDNVRYAGGVGGLTIPLNKAISQWNKAKHADLDIIGHWHQRMSTKNSVVNGSIVGYNAYAQSIKAEFERPQQSFFLIHPKWGKTVEAPIFVD